MSQLVGDETRTTTVRTTDPARPSHTVVELAAAGTAEVEAALAAASAAAAGWARATAGQRSAVLSRAADELAARSDELASLITREEGKPLSSSTGEVRSSSSKSQPAWRMSQIASALWAGVGCSRNRSVCPVTAASAT